ncbi:hypothetical protein A2U01_0090493, partial [Trifolium medium]|nr:hypothetical protein [Trifolium medium]
SDIGSNAADL